MEQSGLALIPAKWLIVAAVPRISPLAHTVVSSSPLAGHGQHDLSPSDVESRSTDATRRK